MYIDSQGCSHRKPSNILRPYYKQVIELTVKAQATGLRLSWLSPTLSNPHRALWPLMQDVRSACNVHRKLKFKSEAAVSSTSKGFWSKCNNLFSKMCNLSVEKCFIKPPTGHWTACIFCMANIKGLIDYNRKCVTFFYLFFLFCPWSLGASDASWKASCNLMIPIWQHWSPHAKHLGRWHPATRLIAGQISRLSLMCRQGLQWPSALTLNNLVLTEHQIIYNLYRPPSANSRSRNNSDGWVSAGSERERGKRHVN